MNSLPVVIDKASATAFVQWCVGRLGLGYHPDTPFADYIDTAGNAVFTPDEVAILNARQVAAFSFCDPYEVGMEEFQRLVPELKGSSP